MTRTSRRWWLLGAAALVPAAGACGNGTSGTGGAGGSGTVVTGGAGGGCLPASAFAELFTIADPGFCAVARYQADVALAYQMPSWGAHGGPLTMEQDPSGGGVTLARWKPPAGAVGDLVKTEAHVDAMIPAGAFASLQANDLPFFGWTAFAWTGSLPDLEGKIVMVKDATVDRSYDANGAYALAGAGDTTSGRLFFTGLSALGATAAATNGLYAADACDTPKPDLGAGQGCQASQQVASWGDASGPVVADRDGNVFAVLASWGSGGQEARGFSSAEVARGAPPVEGTTLFALEGFGSSLAAITPRDGRPGLLAFQPFDAGATPLDVVVQAYTVGSSVTPSGTPTKLLQVVPSSPATLDLMTDSADRLWVTVPGATGATFVVIDRAPAAR